MSDRLCPNCGRRIDASSPDYCQACGTSLDPAPYSARAYYQLASERAAHGDDAAALELVRQGLRHHDASELHLLAAILCRRLGSTEAMRAHVAAIPVDDSLRAEAEWLLRSYRDDDDRTGDLTDVDPALAALLAPPPAPAAVKPRRRRSRWVTLTLLLAGIALAWMLVQFERPGTANEEMAPSERIADPGAPDSAPTTAGNDDPDGETAEPTAAMNVTPTVQPFLLPTPTIPPNLVEQSASNEAIAAAEPESNPTARFDLEGYLLSLGNEELAILGVAASTDAGQLSLTGYVESFLQREELTALANEAPGIARVNATELYIRPPATYTVEAGDTLWTITYAIYGDIGRMQDVYFANQDVMASPESLTVGMVLKLPPYTQN